MCNLLKGPPYLNAIYVKPSDHLAHTTWHPVHWPLQRDTHIYIIPQVHTDKNHVWNRSRSSQV